MCHSRCSCAAARRLESPVHSSATRRRGFTIVELMLVVGIIAILSSLLLVGLRMVSRQALVSRCLSHLRELGNAHASYANLYNECFVDVGLPHGGGGDPKKSFVNTLDGFGVNEATLRSPLDQSPHWSPETGDGAPVVMVNGQPLYRRTSYGMNNYLSRTYSPNVATGIGLVADRLARVPRPSEVVCFLMMTERGSYASSDHPHVENWSAVSNPAALAATQCSINAIDRRKASGDSRSNWCFVDGHVATHRFDEVFASSSDNRFKPGL